MLVEVLDHSCIKTVFVAGPSSAKHCQQKGAPVALKLSIVYEVESFCIPRAGTSVSRVVGFQQTMATKTRTALREFSKTYPRTETTVKLVKQMSNHAKLVLQQVQTKPEIPNSQTI